MSGDHMVYSKMWDGFGASRMAKEMLKVIAEENDIDIEDVDDIGDDDDPDER